MSRAHPYDLVFGAPEFEEQAFPAIREEAEARGVDVRDRQRFVMLAQVGELMRSLLPPDANETAVAQFSDIVTHAYHYWLAEKRTFTVEEDALRALLQGEPIGAWDMVPPAPAGYVQLPRNLLFARISEESHAEAVDGFFFIMPGVNDAAVPPYEYLSVVFILGLLPNRGGFSIVSVQTPVTAEHGGHFGDLVARETGSDFSNVLPGGEDRLLAITSELEALKLVARVFWHLHG